jgi:flagellar basal body-associated protein FliL
MTTTNSSQESGRSKSFFTDSLKTGLLIGIITPALGVVVYYYWQIAPNPWHDFFKYLLQEKKLLSSLTVICLLPNIACFTWFINSHKDKTAKGIFAATVVYAIASLLIKFLA